MGRLVDYKMSTGKDLKDSIYEYVKHLVSINQPQICRHLVALNLLDLLERHGESLNIGLVEALNECSNGDERALKIIDKLFNPTTEGV